MRRLNNQDSLMAAGEAAGWGLHIACLQLHDDGLDLERVRDLFAARLPHLPAFRQRLVTVPADLDRAVWVEAEVDVADHVHGIRVPAPGDDRRLGAVVGDLFAQPFDRHRPLWDAWVLEGLRDGRVGVLTRVHHTTADGMRGVALLAATLDLDQAAPLGRAGGAPGAGPDADGPVALLASGGLHLAGAPARWARTGIDVARAAGRLVRVVAGGRSSGLTLPLTAPATRFNRAVTGRREVAFCRLPLGPAVRAARREGVTVNDVVLALCGGALRRHLGDLQELPESPLIAAVPVGAGTAGADSQPVGNRWAVMFVSLATDVADLDERMRAIAVSARAGKAVNGALGTDLWEEVLDVPPAAIRVLARGYAALRLADRHPPLVNAVVSDLRGPSVPLFCAGARVTALHPFGPVADGLGPNITVLSYEDALDVGITVCPDVFGDPWLLIDALRAEAAELARRYPA